MSLLPIVDRELRARARQGTTYWSRCGVATFAALLGLQSVLVYGPRLRVVSSGAIAFSALAWLGFGFACAAAAGTADCVSRERREGTLGILFLTDLAGADVALGKIAAAGLTSFYALIAFIPALALALLQGGVTLGQIGRTALALLNMIFISLAAGLFVSTGVTRQAGAMRWAFALIFLLLGLPWFMFLIATWVGFQLAPLLWFSAFYTFQSAQSNASPVLQPHFWAALAIGQAEGWTLLVGAAMRLGRSWRSPAQIEERLRKGKLSFWGGRSARRQLMQARPVCWLALRVHRWRGLAWAAVGLLLVNTLGFALTTRLLRGWAFPAGVGLWNGTHLALTLASAALFAWAAGRLFFEARRSGELELLLSTPLGGQDIINGYWWSLWLELRGPLLLLLFMMIVAIVFLDQGVNFLVLFGFLNAAMQVLDAVTLCWVGLWFGLTARKPVQVMLWTVGLVIVLPAIASYLCIFGLSFGITGSFIGAPFGFFFMSPLFHVLKDVVLINWAARRLREQLRTTAPLAVGDWLR